MTSIIGNRGVASEGNIGKRRDKIILTVTSKLAASSNLACFCISIGVGINLTPLFNLRSFLPPKVLTGERKLLDGSVEREVMRARYRQIARDSRRMKEGFGTEVEVELGRWD